MTKITLKELIKTNTQSYQKSDNWAYINYLDTGNLTENYIREIICLDPNKDDIPSRAKRKVKIGDILYSTVRPNQKHYGYIEKFYDNLLVSTGFVVIEPDKSKVNGKYLYYYLTQKDIIAYLQTIAENTVATYPSISPKDIENMVVDFPTLRHQDKIVHVLSNYDDLIENNNRRIKILEEMAQKIYKEWFVDFKFPGHETTTFKDSPLGKIPNNWEVKKVVELSTLSKGKSYKSSELVDKKDGLPFLNLKCVERDGGFKREGLKWFCGKYNDNHVVLPEDIIMAVTDMTQERKLVARPARIPHNWYKKYIMSMDLVKLVANNDINKTYLYSLLKYSNFSDEVKNHANGVNVLHLNPQNIEQFELVVASEPLRNNFGEIAKRIFNQIDVLYLKNENLKQTRDILLPRLISGEINVENMEIK